jgi:hypothetical protein
MLLTDILDRIRRSDGDEKAQKIFTECKGEGQEAMSREVVLLIAARHLQGKEKTKFLLKHPSLIFPVIIRSLRQSPATTG